MSHTIRPATVGDVPMLAQVVLMALRSHITTGVFDLLIERGEEDRLAAVRAVLTTEQPSWCHYTNFLVACVDGEPAAALSGYAAHDETLMPLEQTLLTAMHAVGMDEEAIGAPGIMRMLRRH